MADWQRLEPVENDAQLTLIDAKQSFGSARGHPNVVVAETSTEVHACVVASWSNGRWLGRDNDLVRSNDIHDGRW